MKAFKLTLFILGLIIGISFSMTPLQKKPCGAEAQTYKPGSNSEFSEIEETVISVIADLVKDDSYDSKCSVCGLNCEGGVCVTRHEMAQKTIAPFRLNESEMSQTNIAKTKSVFTVGRFWWDLRIE